MSVQIRSAVKLCKTFLPAMAKARQGRVLFMLTSYLLGAPPKNTAAYVMVKSTLQGLAKSLAADYASFWRHRQLRDAQHDGNEISGRHQRPDRTGQRGSQPHEAQRPCGGTWCPPWRSFFPRKRALSRA